MSGITDNMVQRAMQRAQKNNLPRDLFAKAVVFDHEDELMTVKLMNGKCLIFSLNEFPSLRKATPKQRDNWEFIGSGIGVHWEDIDEDLSVKGFIQDYIIKTKKFIKENESLVA
ncbi:MAG: DUF2442 domain-containing protein [Bacteroidota bacterium]